MKGLFAYVLPKLVKTVGGVVAGLFVFTAFKLIYEKYFPILQASLTSFSSVADQAFDGSTIAQMGLQDYRWFDLLNYILPIPETINTLAYYVPAVVTVYVCKFVFRVLDVWMQGVLAITKGG